MDMCSQICSSQLLFNCTSTTNADVSPVGLTCVDLKTQVYSRDVTALYADWHTAQPAKNTVQHVYTAKQATYWWCEVEYKYCTVYTHTCLHAPAAVEVMSYVICVQQRVANHL